jgi:hypothetical protein
MTGQLTDLMHERADHLGAPEIDLVAITRDGERRVRRRRTAWVGAVAAAAVLAALAAPVLVGGAGEGSTRRDVVADGTAAEPQPLAWISGSVLHRPGRSDVDLGVEVRAWVWAGDDIVFTDPQHWVRLWSDDALDVIGRTAPPETDSPELVADGTSVAWVSEEQRVLHYDVARREAVWGPELPGRNPRVTALDGSDLYAVDSAGVYAWQPSAPDAFRTLEGDLGEVLDAEGGTTVRKVDTENRAILSRNGELVQLSTRQFANLSPDGALVAVENDDLGQVVDATSGTTVPFEHGHEWAVGYGWLDEATLAVLAFDGIEGDSAQTAWLLTCDGRSGVCDRPGTEVPAGYGDFQLPMGIHFSE